jgi:hypothetical protein
LPLPCEHFLFQFAYPNWWNVVVKNSGSAPQAPVTYTVDIEKKKKVLTCELNHIPAYKKEEYKPYYKEVSSYLEFMVTEIEMAGVMYEGPKDWNAIVSRYKDYMLDRNGFLSTRVSSTTKSLIEGMIDPLQKIDTIVSYVQKNIKISDDDEDRNFADILVDKKGNPYAITGLVHSMLKKAGFTPQFVLVHSAEEGNCDDTYHNLSQFSIPAVIVPAGDRECVITPYRKDTRIDQIPEILQGQKALIFSEKNENKFRMIPDEGGAANHLTEHFDATISESGTVTIAEVDSLEGTGGYYLRSIIEKSPADERENFVKKYFAANGIDAVLDSYSFDNEKDYKLPFVIHIQYHSDNMVTFAGDEIIFQPAGIFSPTTIKESKIEIEERQNPIKIHFVENDSKLITLHFPEQWIISTTLAPMNISNTLGAISSRFVTGKGTLQATFWRSLLRVTQPKDKIDDLIALVGRDSKVTLPSIVFQQK